MIGGHVVIIIMVRVIEGKKVDSGVKYYCHVYDTMILLLLLLWYR